MRASFHLFFLFFFLVSQLAPVRAISSTSSKHLEPVLNARLTFQEEAESTRRRREESNQQPFPSSLNLSFKAFETKFSFELQVFTELTDGATITFSGEDDAHAFERPLRHKVYRGTRFNELGEKIGWINLVAHEDGLFNALFLEEGELYSITPLSNHEAELDTKAKRDLESLSDLVISKESDVLETHKICGAITSQYINPLKTATTTSDAAASSEQEETTTYHPQGRINRNLLVVQRWTNCFPNNAVTRRFDVAFYMDFGYYKAVGKTPDKAEESILSIISQSNIIYLTQVNVFLFPGSLTVKTALNADAFNQVRGNCTDVDTTLVNFRNWRRTQQNENDGTYHILTDCYPPPGVVGLAYIGVLCLKSFGAGLSTYHSTTWKTVAHEIGHNFGAEHTFQEGQGTTGGIMDYGDGKLNGEYQFNSKYNKAEVCAEITSSMASTGTDYVKNCWKNFVPKCGNGVVEPGEDCDDDSICCSGCKFIAGGQCSTGPCCQNCQFAPSTVTCGFQGYCSNGNCTQSVCAQYSNLVFCGNKPANRCEQVCTYNGGTECLTLEDNFNLNGRVADGTVCNTSPYSTCKSGACQLVTSPIWVSSSFTCLLACGAETATRTVTCQKNGTVVADSQCTGTKPATSASCNKPSCESSSFAWIIMNGTCDPVTCAVNNTVYCEINGEEPVADSYCLKYASNTKKPKVPTSCCTSAQQQISIGVGAGVGGFLGVVVIAGVLLYFLYFKKRTGLGSNGERKGSSTTVIEAPASSGPAISSPLPSKPISPPKASSPPPKPSSPSPPSSSAKPGSQKAVPPPKPAPPVKPAK